MSRPILTDAERIAALENECALLAASLRQAKAEGAAKAKQASITAIDCAAVFSEQSEWHLTLYKAMGKFVDQGEHESNGLSFADRDTISGLAGIGLYLADGGFGTAERYSAQAKEVAHD
jgi:hypothetical protein